MTTTKKVSRIVIAVAVVVAVLIVATGSFAVIDEGYVGVKYQFGKIVNDNLSAGLNFKIPFVQTIKSVDVREQVYELDTNAYTKDTQTVEDIKIKLNYIYDRSQLSNIIRNVGINNVESKLIVPQLQSILKNAIGQYRAEELVQSRSALQEQVEESLRESLSASGINVVSFAIENIDFEDSFEEAVRAKVVAEQDALKMQNKTKEKEEEAKQIVIAAQAEADSAKIKADADAYAIEKIQQQIASSPEYLEFQKLEKWDGALPQIISDGVNPFVSISGN